MLQKYNFFTVLALNSAVFVSLLPSSGTLQFRSFSLCLLSSSIFFSVSSSFFFFVSAVLFILFSSASIALCTIAGVP